MKVKIIWLIISCLLVITMLLASCGTKTTPTTQTTSITTTKPTSTVPTTKPATIIPTTKPTTATTGNWWDKFGEPQYGGTIIVRKTTDYPYFDPYFGVYAPLVGLEGMGALDWVVDRKIWDFKTRFIPDEYRVGLLAESWEQPDLQTIIFHLHKGVYWQNKPPVNGREMNADDVVFSFSRLQGLGNGFTKPAPTYASSILLKSVTATDKYTVVFKYKEPSITMFSSIMDILPDRCVVAPETAPKMGDTFTWQTYVGTGPFILTDYTSGSSLTSVRNPNYWGYDQHYPKNKLPYADGLRILIIPDEATALSALRTGKIDLMSGLQTDTMNSLKRINPEILLSDNPTNGYAIHPRCDYKPFTDIRVRKALQMAIDLKTIASSYYGGVVDGTPCGLVSPSMNGYYTPYNEWPQELKNEFVYNPEGAKKLLAEAGYPQGFKTNIVAASNQDLALLQIAKSNFLDIGVDMEIRVMDPTAYSTYCSTGKMDQMSFGIYTTPFVGMPFPPSVIMTMLGSSRYDYTNANDPVMLGMIAKWRASLNPEEQRKLLIQIVDYDLKQHYTVKFLPRITFTAYQSWFKGYSGEVLATESGAHYMRLWIDKNLKKSMGY